jgi:hypothetical protein
MMKTDGYFLVSKIYASRWYYRFVGILCHTGVVGFMATNKIWRMDRPDVFLEPSENWHTGFPTWPVMGYRSPSFRGINGHFINYQINWKVIASLYIQWCCWHIACICEYGGYRTPAIWSRRLMLVGSWILMQYIVFHDFIWRRVKVSWSRIKHGGPHPLLPSTHTHPGRCLDI